jgi:hypothetical protein
MTTETLQRAIHRRPFVPFTLRLADGHQLPVNHPDFIMHPPGARTAVVWVPDQSYYEIIDLLLVVGLVVEQEAVPGSA